MAVVQSLISPWKRRGEKEKKLITTRGIRIWSLRQGNPTGLAHRPELRNTSGTLVRSEREISKAATRQKYHATYKETGGKK